MGMIGLGTILFTACGSAETGGITSEQELVKDTTAVMTQEVLPDGEYTENYSNGALKIKGTIVNGQRFGVWVSYHKNGNKASESNYVRGELFGKTVAYHPNGQVAYIGYYEYGEKSGKWQFFSEDGTLSREQSF